MKCKCGGELFRIADDAYQCNICGKKQAVAFAKAKPTKETNCININVVTPIGMSNKLLKDLADKIASGISEKYLNNK